MLYHVLSLLLIASFCGGDLSEQDVNEVISSYRQANVETFKRGMPPPSLNEQFRASIHASLPTEFKNRLIEDSRDIELLREVLKPILSFYGRLSVYDVVIVRSPTPLMMSDSGVVLVVTTGMIENALSDDELVGYAAHEVGHEYFVFYSVESRHLLQTISTRGREADLTHKVGELLALIELHCDAFATVTLSALRYNSLDFIRGLERSDAQYPTIRKDNHPATAVRRRVIEGLASVGFQSRQTSALKELKTRLRTTPADLDAR